MGENRGRMNPYRIEGPALISVSGGRTSGYMLAKILEAHGGALPKDVLAVFANTGLEHPATYDFLREMGERWWPIIWLEHHRDRAGKPSFRLVTYDDCSRDGEPFAAVARHKKLLPNPAMRWCTDVLKVSTMRRYMKSLGYTDYDNAIGLRADEQRRVHRMKAGDSVVVPMYDAGHTVEDVLAFWREQPFDLELPDKNIGIGNSFGNCVGCFLKSRKKLEDLMRAEPQHFDWWVRMEREMEALPGPDGEDRRDFFTSLAGRHGIRFRQDRPSYAAMLEGSRRQGRLFENDDEETVPCMCTD